MKFTDHFLSLAKFNDRRYNPLCDDMTVTDVGGTYRNYVTWYFLHLRNNHRTCCKTAMDNKTQKNYVVYFTLYEDHDYNTTVIRIVAVY